MRWLFALGLLGCKAPQKPTQPDIIWITVDTLRADRLGHYGGPSTPHFDQWATGARCFEQAISPSAWTLPATASLFTGVSPDAHGVLRHNLDDPGYLDRLSDQWTTVAEHASANGYATGALLKSHVLRADFGFAQGFEHYQVVPGAVASGPSGQELSRAAIRWLNTYARGAKPALLYLHYMDPHSPYRAPGSHSNAGSHAELRRLKSGHTKSSPERRAQLRALYDAEVREWDRAFGALLRQLRARQRDTVILVSADHGEQIGEHSGWLHEHLWQENVHVPLCISGPNLPAGRRAGWVSTQQIGATLADAAGLPPFAHGTSLLRDLPRQPVFSHYATQRAVWTGVHKLYLSDNVATLYDLQADPQETAPLDGSTVALRQLITNAREAGIALGKSARSPIHPLSDEQRAAFEALGYLEPESLPPMVE